MLDSKMKNNVKPILNYGARILISKNISAITITYLALIFGLIATLFLILNYVYLSVVTLWVSGLFDALDGTVARLSNTKSKLGGFLDITFDRVVEISMLIALAYINPNLYVITGVVFAMIILSMTIFLTSGNLIREDSEKVFYYQVGIAERTEGFIFITLAIVFKDYGVYILSIFAGLILMTAIQRFIQTYQYLKEK
ncbi:MAG: CDP-alcohol phosphatidyltransferase family protein [Bacilli bacterium]